MGHERAPISQEPSHPPSCCCTQLFLGLGFTSPILGPPRSSCSSSFSPSVCLNDGQMTSTHVCLLSIHPTASFSWPSCLGISSPSPFHAASSISQTHAQLSHLYICLFASLFSVQFPHFSSIFPSECVFAYQHLLSANTPPRSHGLGCSWPDVMNKD